MKKILLFIFCVLMLFSGAAPAVPLVYVSILPQLESVQVIGEGICRGDALLKYGQSPETFQMNARTLEALGKAGAFIGIGQPFERVVIGKLRSIYPEMVIVDSSEGMNHCGIDGRKLPPSAGLGQSHADPHLWLSIENMLIHCRVVEEVLIRRFPSGAHRIRENGARYRGKLLSLQSRIASELAFCRGRTVLVYHPAFGYFLREYGLKQCPVEKDGKAPGGRYLDQLIRKIRSEKIGTLFYQPQFSERMASNLSRRMNLQLVVLDPLPMKYSEGLQQMADKVAASCRRPPAAAR